MTAFFRRGDAVISLCGRYRYWLWRSWGTGPRALFVMLNPSKADADEDDPTIRRCIGFARDMGAGSLGVVNLYAWRSFDPAELLIATDPIGPSNDRHIYDAAGETIRSGGKIVCAWGANIAAAGPTGSPHDGRGEAVVKLLAGLPLYCLKTTARGFPSHPLYLPGALRPVRFAAEAV